MKLLGLFFLPNLKCFSSAKTSNTNWKQNKDYGSVSTSSFQSGCIICWAERLGGYYQSISKGLLVAVFDASSNIIRKNETFCIRIRTRQGVCGQILPFAWGSSQWQSPRELPKGNGLYLTIFLESSPNTDVRTFFNFKNHHDFFFYVLQGREELILSIPLSGKAIFHSTLSRGYILQYAP